MKDNEDKLFSIFDSMLSTLTDDCKNWEFLRTLALLSISRSVKNINKNLSEIKNKISIGVDRLK